ncbi:MAG: DUF4214 domain-containing protein [Methylococcaceae bacterium]|nr:DUF4214 domain-containing protein [Methylococcaceae bacterium]
MSSNQTSIASLTLRKLLSYDDSQFIVNAYRTLLGRHPDSEGMSYYLARLQAGVSKVEILAQLSNSVEGKSRQVTIAGLDDAIRHHKRLKTPVLGSLLRLAEARHTMKNKQHDLAASETEDELTLVELLASYWLSEDSLPAGLNLGEIHRLNPCEHFDDFYQAVFAVLKQSPVRKLSIHEDAGINAHFYVSLAQHYEGAGQHEQAIELYRLSLLFMDISTAHEHLGNLALVNGRHYQAIGHYTIALDLGSSSHWVYVNMARAQKLSGQYETAIQTICTGLKAYPGAELMMLSLDEYINDYWGAEEQKIECLAVAQNREKLITEYERVTAFIGKCYAQVFRQNSVKPLSNSLNSGRVLIVGLPQDVLPQCFRYRIEQKLEQLAYAGYHAETVVWHEYELALSLINFYDLIIFYRVPATPGILKLVEYAKALGKVTFYEVDDLLFESFSVPPIETYGGQVSLAIYTNLTKDIGSVRAIAGRCEYAIASTLPLLEKLAPLSQSKKGYLHRNGLDKYTRYQQVALGVKDYINLFYGSGTLAHNTDFIVEALPAISRILKEHKHVKLTIVGYLSLPDTFLAEFEGKVAQVPFVKDIDAYLAYLSGADINLAVLHDNVLSGCKSELKWFEAGVFSIPSVVSRTQNYLDVIEHGVDGFVVSGEQEWYGTLKQLVENADLRRRIGSKAYDRVKAEYSVPVLADNIQQIMTSALSNHQLMVADE